MAKSRTTRTRKAGARRVKSAAKRAAKTARRKGTKKQASRKSAKKQASRKSTRKAASRKSTAGRGRKSAAKRTSRQTRGAGRATKRSTKSVRKTRKSARPSGGALRAARGAGRKTVTRGLKSASATTRPTATPRGASRAARAVQATAKRPPALERERRRLPEAIATLPDDAQVTLGESVHRSSRAVNGDVTGGDIDATRQTAYDTGDEAPGGDNPTPDQDIVDQIGHSLGLEYEDEEELKGADKVEQRDRHRWELDPASSEDYNDRD